MDGVMLNPKDELVMKLLHYFITEEGYNPIILHGGENEIWLENLEAPYKIVRIMTGHIHNKEQLDYDLYKTKTIMTRIKRKTFSFKMNALSIFLDLGDNVDLLSPTNIECIKLDNEKDINEANQIKQVFPSIVNKLKFTEDGLQLFTKITNDINEKNKQEALKTEEIFKVRIPYVTFGLIALNVLIFIAMYFFGNGSYDVETLLNFGALAAPYVRAGEYFRLITAAFVHVGILHLFFNMYALYVLGKQLENFYGSLKFLMIYLFSALIGSLVSMIMTAEAVSAGASGAIFGLLGSMLYFGYHYRVYLGNVLKTQIIPLIVLNLAISFVIPGIDQFAHLGGLFGGFIISTAVGVKHKSSKFEIINGLVVSLLTLIFLIYIAFIYIK